MISNKIILFFLAFLVVSFSPPEEEVIVLVNSSFEGQAGIAPHIGGWYSDTPESSPDLLPGAWGEEHPANHGSTCLGLVVRKTGSTEDLTQELPSPLKSGVCWKIAMDLAKAKHYAKHNKPCRIRIWGGTKDRKKSQLLASSPLIFHEEWKRYTMQFTPKADYRYLTIEAYFAPGATFKYQGNVLIDNCSVIERCIRA